jgi:molybdopterin molybdotransferase
MILLDEAQALIAQYVEPLEAETLPLAAAGGRVLAGALTAALTQPPFAASAMDGYAVHASDLTGRPVTLRIAGAAAAGHVFDRALERGAAIRVSTGAALPPGANQVVIQENTVLDDQPGAAAARPYPPDRPGLRPR